MMSSASTVIDRLLAAMNALDVDGFVSCYASSATIEDGEDRVLARGHEEIRSRYRQMFIDFPNLHVEQQGRWAVGQYIVEDECVTGRERMPERHIAVYLVVDGQIVRERLLR
jgi:hypothetical protein